MKRLRVIASYELMHLTATSATFGWIFTRTVCAWY